MKKKLFAVLFAALLGLHTTIPNIFMESIQIDNDNTVSLLFLDDNYD